MQEAQVACDKRKVGTTSKESTRFGLGQNSQIELEAPSLCNLYARSPLQAKTLHQFVLAA